jgi:hypothetical protein
MIAAKFTVVSRHRLKASTSSSAGPLCSRRVSGSDLSQSRRVA